MNLPRRYDEKEIGRLLRRATELQTAEPTAPNPGGMTLEELEEIAFEAGIDPDYLRRAAQELESGASGRTFWERVVGDSLTLTYETEVPGEVTDAGFERVLAVIQEVAHEHGQPRLLGSTLTWQAETPTKSRSLMVVVASRDGGTRVRVEERLHQLAGQLFGGGTGGFGVGVGVGLGLPLGLEALGSLLFAGAFPVGMVGLAHIVTREIYRARVRGRRRALSALFDRIVQTVQASAAEGTLQPVEERGALEGS